jgi:GMP synthase (glutamine-hydrolysing)
MRAQIAILDFGSQYTQLIARRYREMGVYCEIHPFNIDTKKLVGLEPSGIVLSGGPSSVYDEGAPLRSVKELSEIAPVLGICYGMQMIAREFGGKVSPAKIKEYGLNHVVWDQSLVKTKVKKQSVWMSHGDVVEKEPKGFERLAHSSSRHLAAMKSKRILAFQFHPEVSHTQNGGELLKYFAKKMCQAPFTWTAGSVTQELIERIKAQVGHGERVLCALSGGVDSTVVGVLLTKALGKARVSCVFVNTGLLRKDEFQEVKSIYKKLGLNLLAVDASERFLERLKGVTDPEKKRKIIGHTFIDSFDQTVKEAKLDVAWLAQGTLYPDVIESVSARGTSVTIKTHHNVGGLPENMKLKLIEPLRELFKDEVRRIGRVLKIDEKILGRHPFPGPGLAVRILGEVREDRLSMLRDCDAIFIRELKNHGLYNKIWQAFCALLPVRSVGVQGDSRSYGQVVVLRAVTSSDGMTADWYPFDGAFLRHVSNCITNEVKAVNRVVYDITSKPPGTIEWE